MGLFERLNSIKSRPSSPKETIISSDGIPGGREISVPAGMCLVFESRVKGGWHFPSPDTSGLYKDLKLIRGIGPATEEKLKREGLNSLDRLLDHPRWGSQALLVKNLIEEGRMKEVRNLGACDRDILCRFTPGDVVFLDIESAGLWPGQPLFLIGLLFSDGEELVAQQFFARHYREEKAVLEAAHRRLGGFRVIVTFNGKRFDIPYIEGRSVEHRLFYRYRQFQVDLLYHARRRYSSTLPDCRLATLEEHLLKFRREGDIPGHLIPQTYHRFVRTRDPGLMLPVINHNRLDLIAMASLFHLVESSIS